MLCQGSAGIKVTPAEMDRATRFLAAAGRAPHYLSPQGEDRG